MEKRLPFIAAIISSAITWVATYLYFREYLWVATIVLFVAIALLRFNAWALIGSFLTGLAIELYYQGAHPQFSKVLIVLAIGILIQLLVPIASNTRATETSITQNTLFAFLGVLVAYGIQFKACEGYSGAVNTSPVALGLATKLYSCYMDYAFRTLMRPEYADLNLHFWNAAAGFMVRVLLMSAPLWACFMAAVSRERFDPRRLPQIIQKTASAWAWGLLLPGLLILVSWAILGIMGVFVNDPTIQEVLVLFAVIIHVYLISWGAGRAVT